MVEGTALVPFRIWNANMTRTTQEFPQIDVVEIERNARALQAQVLAEMFGALRRAVVARLTRSGAAQTA